MKKLLLISFLLSAFFLNTSAQKYHRVKAQISQKQIETLYESGFEADHYHLENGTFTAEISDGDIKILKDKKIKFSYLIKDLEKNLPKINKEIDKKNARNARIAATPANFTLGSYNGYFSWQQMQNILDQMQTLYPHLITAKTSIGNSVEGRPVYMVKISDNPNVDENEPELFLNALHHAREPVSLSQLIYYMWHILENYDTDDEIKTLINSTELYIVPCVNPDGYVFNQTTNPNGGGMWRKNRRNNGNGTFGVDINRNYGFQWGYDNTGSSPTTSSATYRGPSAFSEPETQIIRNFCNQHDFVASMDFHSFGNYCIYPFGYSSSNNNPEISLFAQMGAYLTAENGFTYGNAFQTVNYVANGAGDDWKYGEQSTKNKIYSFTPEVGTSSDGFYPAQSRIIPLCESTLQMNRKILKLSSKYAELATANNINLTSTNGNISFTIQNFSLRNPSYTVSISSNSPYISSLGSNQSFANMSLFQNNNSQISFGLLPETPIGSNIILELKLDNGHTISTKYINVIYTCEAPVNLTSSAVSTNQATVSWNNLAGASSYVVNYKLGNSSTWSNDLIVNSNSLILQNLTPNTAYDWRVKSNTCENFSQSSFTTLALCNPPSNLNSLNITANAATLTWTSIQGASSYRLEYKTTSSSTWTLANGTISNTSFSINGLTAQTAYQWRVRSNCSSGTSSFTESSFTTSAFVANYCSSAGSNISFFWIDNVNLNNLTRVSGQDNGYFNGTNLNAANLVKATSNTVTLSAGYSGTRYRVYWRVWIDYNQNGSFNDPGELITSFSSTSAGNINRNFTVPSSATNGITRMRVSAKYGSSPSSCETFTYGEVEDYNVNISGAINLATRNTKIGVIDSHQHSEEISDQINAVIYPNPVGNVLEIDFKTTNTENLNIKILDLSGKVLYREKLTDQHRYLGIEVKYLNPNMYLLILEKDDKLKSLKFVKE